MLTEWWFQRDNARIDHTRPLSKMSCEENPFRRARPRRVSKQFSLFKTLASMQPWRLGISRDAHAHAPLGPTVVLAWLK